MAHFSRSTDNVFMHNGWARLLPPYAQAPLFSIAAEEGATREQIHAELARRDETAAGLESTAWEPLRQWTDAELRELDEQFGDPGSTEPLTSAAEVIAEEAATRDCDVRDLARYAEHLGVPPITTIGDLLDLMVATSVLLLRDGVYTINPDAQLPEEVLPLSREVAAAEDEIRWRDLHSALSSSVITLFHPDSPARVKELHSTLAGIAHETESDPESVRAAIDLLTAAGDFSTTTDIERLTIDDAFTLRVDWDLFARTRIGVRFTDSEA